MDVNSEETKRALELMNKAELREEQERGAAALDYQWDRNLRGKTKAFIVGYITRFFALYAAASSPAEAQAFYDAVGLGVKALGVGRPNQKEN